MSLIRESLEGDQSVGDLLKTVVTLRKIRGAAIAQPLSNQQSTLSDGEELAESSARFLGRYVFDGQIDEKSRTTWQQTLLKHSSQYQSHYPVSYTQVTPEATTNALLRTIQIARLNPKFMVNYALFSLNDLGVKTPADLLTSRRTILAPLSSDLLEASLYQNLLFLKYGQSFKLKTVAISSGLGEVILPDLSSETLPIGIFIDMVNTGRTGQAVFQSIQYSYPSLLVHPPKTDPIY